MTKTRKTVISSFNSMQEKEQLLLLVDKEDNFKQEYARREDCHKGKGLHHRAFVVVLYNDKNEILIQKRKHPLWNGFWDISATSHVLHLKDHNESYEEASRRCLKKELGIDDVSIQRIGGFNYFETEKNYSENEYCAVFVGQYTGAVIPNSEILYEYIYKSFNDILREIKTSPNLYTPWAIHTFHLLENQNFLIEKKLSHVAFIMDGNRRWARHHKLPLMLGHKKGYEQLEPLIKHAIKLFIHTLTFWAFSTENWNRDKEEVEYLLSLFRDLFKSKMLQRIKKKGGKIVVLGDIDPFPQDLQENIKKIVHETKDNTKITVNIALNYGGREEILYAVNSILRKGLKTVDATVFNAYLYSAYQKDPDMIIRTGGAKRLSGFLPWQSVYSELYFTEKYWPEFTTREFDEAVKEYEHRERRFGK